MSTAEEKSKLMKAFVDLDVNRDGKLSREELMKGYGKVKSFTPSDIDIMIKKYDTNGSGYIDYSEFVTASIDKDKLLSKQRVESFFALCDRDGNGKISANELKDMLSGSTLNNDSSNTNVWNDIIKEVDKNNDGEVGVCITDRLN